MFFRNNTFFQTHLFDPASLVLKACASLVSPFFPCLKRKERKKQRKRCSNRRDEMGRREREREKDDALFASEGQSRLFSPSFFRSSVSCLSRLFRWLLLPLSLSFFFSFLHLFPNLKAGLYSVVRKRN